MTYTGMPALRLRGLAYLIVALSISACGQSQPAQPPAPQPGLTVSDAYMPLPPPGRPMAAIYMQLQNTGDRDRHIIQVQTEIAGLAEVHRSIHEDGVVRMRRVPEPVVPAGQTLAMEPGGYHVMLMDMAPLAEGQEQFELNITLDGDETVVANVQVRAR